MNNNYTSNKTGSAFLSSDNLGQLKILLCILMVMMLLLLGSNVFAQSSGNGANSTPNPNGLIGVTVPANTFNNVVASTGSVQSIRIYAFPSGALTLTVAGIPYTLATFPAGGITVTSDVAGTPTQTITVDPINDGETTVVIPYKVVVGGTASTNTGLAVLHLTAASAIPCATTELMSNPGFITSPNGTVLVSNVNSNGWTATDRLPAPNTGTSTIDVNTGFGYVYIYHDTATQTFNHSFTGVNPSGAGAILSVNFGLRNGVVGSSFPFSNYGAAAEITFIYAGIPYARITSDNTTLTDGHLATLVYLNSAAGSLPNGYVFDYGASPQSFNNMNLVDWKIYLPGSVPNNGILSIEFNPGSTNIGTPSDDIKLGAVSFKACPLTLSGTVYNDIDGLTDAVVDNNSGAQSGSTLPATLTANLFNAVTGAFVATVNVVNGIYVFPEVTQNTNYIVMLSNVAATSSNTTANFIPTLPGGWVNTGDVNPTDPIATTATPGISAVIEVGSDHTINVNFGIEQAPVAVNDAGTGTVGSPVTVTILGNDLDPSGTPLNTDSVSLTLPIGATNPVVDAQGDVTGFTVPGEGAWTYNSTTGGLTFTPAPGFTGNPTPITYTVTDLAHVNSNVALVTITYPSSNITGTIFNDVNGSGTLDGAETGTTAGTNLYVYLVNSAGLVVDSAKVKADGTYSLGGIPNTAYTIELSTTQYAIGTNTSGTPIINTPPAGWVTTGEGPSNTKDGTPNGTLSVTSGANGTTVVNNNFGIEQPPVAVADQSLNNVTGTAVTINPLGNDTDPTPGTLDATTVSLVAPAGATGIVTDANGDITSMTIPGEGTWTVNITTGAITFTPQIGFNGNPTVILYNIEDNAHVVSNNAPVTITYLAPIIITGTVFDDANGNTITDGTEAGTTAGTSLYVYLINAAGIVVDSAKVLADGTYKLDAGQNLNYTINLSTTQYAVGTNTGTTPIVKTPPAGWITIGENKAGNTGSGDGTPDGVLSMTTGTTNITQQNFAIERLPDSNPRTQPVPYPSGGVISAGTATVPVLGSDPEDGTLGNSNTIVITTLPANAQMYYNGILVTAGQQITGFNPALLSFTNITNGSVNVVFQYAFKDAAGKQDPTPAAYTLSWALTAPLPITLESFTGVAKNCNTVLLNWRVSDAINFNRFEIERSTNGVDFKTVGSVSYSAAIANYSYSENVFEKGAYQYRLKLIDTDGKNKYSPVAFIRLDCNQQQALLVYPNPAKDKVTINGLKGGEKITMYNAQGQLVLTKTNTDYQLNIDLHLFRSGMYYIIVVDKNGEKINESKITKID